MWPIVQWLIIGGLMTVAWLAMLGKRHEAVWTSIAVFVIVVWTVIGYEIAIHTG